ncbi:MAG: cytochrome c oxidase subunit II [Erythrobacter sp.]|uniref:cytochrome c oxidase subunit II n=1 Tax=Erythrobacter sp. TaxID=1042 RepID=UPI00260F3711|nr:cytochrome c oxidase subunit II [Erythrobacter sp.]MDJ0977056.1 cytochrome c oxidase subunit II [Erythrobacter sp.]
MGQQLGRIKVTLLALAALLSAAFAPAALAQDNEAPTAQELAEGAEAVAEAVAPPAYTPMAPTLDKGMPTDPRADTEGAMFKSLTFQDQYTETGAYALWMHDYFLLPVITFISLLVLGLLLYTIVRFSRRANPQPSKTTHNTAIEVIWTILPAAILVVIAVPSMTLLARQYETPPEDAVTIKAIGYQWYWGYEYPDHGGFEVVSNMKSAEDALADGEPFQLAVDNRMVVPAGVPLRIQTTAADVIHAFSVPSLWFKQDAIPGRLNEKLLTIEEPGVYYGQCSELCGTLHGYMPIAVEALPMDEFEAWILEQGGELPGAADAEPEAPVEEATAEGASGN